MAGADRRAGSDLPLRVTSAVVMLAVAGAALWAGGRALDLFIGVVALAAFIEFCLLIGRIIPAWPGRLAGIAAGALYIGLAAAMLLRLDPKLLVVTVVTVIVTDTGAYFAGRSFGGPKIAPAISPSKTWAGLFGGMAAAALWLALSAWFAGAGAAGDWQPVMLAMAAALGALAAIVAQMGDFFESWLKRRAGVKDSSRLIPGHGGVFDRVDGLLPVAILAGALACWAGI